jgi:hypothetical protein
MNKLFDVASCWIYEYTGILIGARAILHISRIKVNSPGSVLEIVTSMSYYDDSYGVLAIVDVMMTIVGVIMMI